MSIRIWPDPETLGRPLTVYFETSAVNHLATAMSVEDAKATRAYQEVRQRHWYISPMVLFEILLTRDYWRRERLIDFCVALFGDRVLPSHEEMVVHYIRAGCPRVERWERFRFSSDSLIAQAWRDIVDGRAETLIVDTDQLWGRVKFFVSLCRDIRKILRNSQEILPNHHDTLTLEIFLNHYVHNLSFIRRDERPTDDQLLSYKVALYFILIVLCAEAGFDSTPIKTLWREIGFNSVVNRGIHLMNRFEVLVQRGPFAQIAQMITLQSYEKFSRGIFADSLHSLYLPYVDIFLTNDGHFELLRDPRVNPNAAKIWTIDELTFVQHAR